MQFRNTNYHQSSFLERTASNLNALEYIIGFKHSHPRLIRKVKKIIKWILIILVFLYLFITIKNAILSDNAFTAVNTYTMYNYGVQVLKDKGFFGHAWFYLTHPIHNIAEAGWSTDVRISKFMYEGLTALGVS